MNKIVESYKRKLTTEEGYTLKRGAELRVALCYPNVYGVGMANLGFHSVYELFNRIPEVSCERVFLPDEAEMREYERIGTPLLSLESQTPVRDFNAVVGRESREQMLAEYGRLPDAITACVGGGSNAIGLFHPFLQDEGVRMTGVEAGGEGIRTGRHAARFQGGKLGVLQGTKTFVLTNADGQIELTHSVSAGLDYAAIGPEHSYLRDSGRIEYDYATDDEALSAFRTLAELEGIIPALETAHAIAHVIKTAPQLSSEKIIIANCSGRGDKDVSQAAAHFGL